MTRQEWLQVLGLCPWVVLKSYNTLGYYMARGTELPTFILRSKWNHLSFVIGVNSVLCQGRNYLQTAAPPTHWTLAGKCSHMKIFRFWPAICVLLLCSKPRWVGGCCFYLFTLCLKKCCFGKEQNCQSLVALLELVIPVLGWRWCSWNRRGLVSKGCSQIPRSAGADWRCE